MALTIPTHFKFKPLNLQHQKSKTHLEFIRVRSTRNCSIGSFSTHHRLVLTRVCSDGGRETRGGPQQPVPYDLESSRSGSYSPADGDVAFFVQMLGLDNDPLEREKAVIALRKYSLRGEQFVDAIMQFHGSINLTVNLLQSDSSSACEAALGLLRTISSVNVYREFVAESGAIEVIIALLSRSFLTSGVKEQSLYTLWNLSIDEKLQEKIANPDLLSLLINFLEDGNKKVKECAGGFLANLARSRFNHKVMVEAGVIPKMAKLLKTDVERSNVSANFSNIDVDRLKVIRKEARNTLLELAKDECYRILVMEEGLLLVPLVGTTAYKSFRPTLDSRPSWPDGTLIEWTPKVHSKYGASEVLLGLRCRDNDANMEEAKINAMAAQSRQRFLARAGCIEMENGENSQGESSSDLQFTILPLLDGVARLVLILGLEDESAIARAAESIASASISNHMRVCFKEAGAVKHLVRLLGHHSDAVGLAVIHALERLSVSNDVCRTIEVEGVLHPLIEALKNSAGSDSLMEKTLNILARILDPSNEMKSKEATRKTGSFGTVDEILVSKSTASLDSAAVALLVGILKTSSPDLQRKAASILEFATDDQSIDKIISADIECGLDAVFQQKILQDTEFERDCQQPELLALKVEEAGLAISAASRLLTRLLDFESFRSTINPARFVELLRKILRSSIPLDNKDWVAACLVKLSSLSRPGLYFENPMNIETTLHETIPRLIEQIKSSSPEVQEVAVLELNEIISEGVVDCTRAVAAEGGIFPLVKLIKDGTTSTAVEAGLAILYNLSMITENHSTIVAAGAFPALERIVRSERLESKRAIHLLRALPT